MKRFALLFLILAVFAGCGGKSASNAESDNLYKETQELMGTFATITAVADKAELPAAQAAVNKAFARLRQIEDLMSFHREDTEVALVNREAFDHPVEVSAETFEVIKAAVQFARDTDGAFDITVGPLVRLWAEAGEAGKLPSQEQIADALTKVGAATKIKLDEEKKTVRFTVKGMSIDLGGIAKGYAVDKAIEVLRAEGVNNAIVEAGGNMTVIGKNAEGKKWIIGVKNFFRKSGHVEQIEVENMAVSTSGDYERFVVIDGHRYSHIIDPRTGMPVEGAASVTVIARDGMTADAWSTAASVLGSTRALEMLRKDPKYGDCQMLFAACTQGFRDYLAPGEEDK
jgi:thiamine biosynthesis lipoprotein